MDGKEENRRIRRKKMKLFFTVMGIYMLIVMLIYLMLSLVNAIISLNAIVRIIGLIAAFVIAWWGTLKLLDTAELRQFLG